MIPVWCWVTDCIWFRCIKSWDVWFFCYLDDTCFAQQIALVIRLDPLNNDHGFGITWKFWRVEDVLNANTRTKEHTRCKKHLIMSSLKMNPK